MAPIDRRLGLLAVAANNRSGEKQDDGGSWTADFPVEKDELIPTGRNPYFVLEPGYQLVLEGGKERLVITVLDETKTVDGVETRVVEERETKDGKLVEVSRNFFAISKRTNSVFYFGEDVDIYKDGKVVRHEGAWLSGVKGAKFGLMVPGQVLLKARYYQEIAPKVAMDRAEIVSLREPVKTPAGEFMNCLKTEETTPLERGEREYKYYARGIGLVQDGSLKLVKYGNAVATSFAEPEAKKTNKPADAKIVYRDDVVYGLVHGAGLLADIAYPESKEPLPAIISVHGGRWVGGHKRDASTIKVEQWAGFGFFAMSIDYRLKNCTPAPACYQDFQCAIRYVHAHAQEYNIDTSRIFLIGQSAGGHMVSLAATLGDGPYPRTGGWDEETNDFRAGVSVAAAYDLVTLDWGALWTPPGVDPNEARAQASPTRHVTAKSKPLLIVHSDNDRSVPIANALTMIEVLEKAGARHTFHRYPEMGHMGINAEVIEKSLAFIKELSAKPSEEQ